MIILPTNTTNIILPKNDLIVVPNNQKIVTSVSYETINKLQHFDAALLNRK